MTLLALPALNGSLEKIPNACIVVSIDFFCFGKFSNGMKIVSMKNEKY